MTKQVQIRSSLPHVEAVCRQVASLRSVLSASWPEASVDPALVEGETTAIITMNGVAAAVPLGATPGDVHRILSALDAVRR
jgi:hypothetical protein